MHGKFLWFCFVCCLLGLFTPSLNATYIYPLEVFTDNGGYCDSPDLNLYIDVNEGQADTIDFTFYNKSLIDCVIARIYFEDDSPLDVVSITNGSGTDFNQPATPANLPAGRSLDNPFEADEKLIFDSLQPSPFNGINPDEWLRISFDLTDNLLYADMIDMLDSGDIRIGTHIIALSDGSSESSISVPEPVCLILFGIGGSILWRKHRA